jgi:GTP-binding protein
MREKDAIEFYNLGLGEYYTFCQYFWKWNRWFVGLIDAFPVKPEPVQEEVVLPRCSSWTS